MRMEHVRGEDRGNIILYALSTCAWCKKTKKLLNSLGVEYSYLYVDLLQEDEKEAALEEIRRHNPLGTVPTIVINDKKSIVGYKEDKIRNLLSSSGEQPTDWTESEQDREEYFSGLLEGGQIDELKSLIEKNVEEAEILVELLKKSDIFVRIGSAMLITKILDEKPQEFGKVKEKLKELLKEDDSTIIQDATMVMGKIGDKSDIETLEKLLESNNDDVKEAAEEAIKEINSRN
ncbi:MAG: glutaredoxin domain-containing protein [Halobacteriota archaeon]